jgi:tetratricopeptide (TPR) repeat protein
VLASELATKSGQDGMAWVAADRAMTAASDSGHPATIAAACRAVAIAMRRLGHYDAATSLLTRTAIALDTGDGSPQGAVLAAYGSLLCTAAYASAQNGRRDQALELITEAGDAASRMSASTSGQSVLSAAGVEVYQIGIHNALGDSAAALGHARRVAQAQLPTHERRARFCIDTARAWHLHGRPDQAYLALLAAERNAPEEIRRSSVRTLIAALTQGPGRRPDGLRQLAVRAGTPM